jgi:hypothetical protein
VAEAVHFERAGSVARSAGLQGESSTALALAAALFAMSGDADRGLPLAEEAVDVARQLRAPGPIAFSLMAFGAVVARSDPEQARLFLGEGIRAAGMAGGMNTILSSMMVFVAAYMGDLDQALDAAPVAIRGFLWTGQRANLAGMLNLVARALAPVEPSTAAIIQGAVRRLVAASQPQSVEPDTQPPVNDHPTNAPSGPVVELRQQTTAILRDTLGDTRLRELRTQGEALEEEAVVALTLDAITRSRPGSTFRPGAEGQQHLSQRLS